MADFTSLFSSLPPVPANDPLSRVQRYWQRAARTIIILDDDPTGTQTVQGVPVLTEFTEEAIEGERERGTPVFFILTNSRSLPAADTALLHEQLGRTIQTVFAQHGQDFILLSRADSTLRGHFPLEVAALANGLGLTVYQTILVPAFFEGGRYTINDVHYLKVDDALVPVAETDFAKDNTFGYQHSDLPAWIEEKTGGVVKAGTVVTFGIAELRNNDIAYLTQKIEAANSGAVMVVNAAAPYDLAQFAHAFLHSNKTAIFRTGASFINALTGLLPASLLPTESLLAKTVSGGLIVVGSHVQKTNRQLLRLVSVKGLVPLELPVDILETKSGAFALAELKKILHDCLAAGKDVVLFTSRQVVVAPGKEESLRLSVSISNLLVGVVASLPVAPRFLIAKGGITSSDIATKALGIKRATVLGQALPGVPVWVGGPESLFPAMPYIIFPGNVGTDDGLKELYTNLKASAATTIEPGRSTV